MEVKFHWQKGIKPQPLPASSSPPPRFFSFLMWTQFLKFDKRHLECQHSAYEKRQRELPSPENKRQHTRHEQARRIAQVKASRMRLDFANSSVPSATNPSEGGNYPHSTLTSLLRISSNFFKRREAVVIFPPTAFCSRYQCAKPPP